MGHARVGTDRGGHGQGGDRQAEGRGGEIAQAEGGGGEAETGMGGIDEAAIGGSGIQRIGSVGFRGWCFGYGVQVGEVECPFSEGSRGRGGRHSNYCAAGRRSIAAAAITPADGTSPYWRARYGTSEFRVSDATIEIRWCHANVFRIGTAQLFRPFFGIPSHPLGTYHWRGRTGGVGAPSIADRVQTGAVATNAHPHTTK
mmetsp:Transcript_24179/g.58425  ORF Transcript_24179/g.58425 Transcript_24179/m.58425 type:complete len:200 (+) Transcript_24179:526-1125(+)